MTLLIACILIYKFDMPDWWYVAACVAWLGRIATANPIGSAIVTGLTSRRLS